MAHIRSDHDEAGQHYSVVRDGFRYMVLDGQRRLVGRPYDQKAAAVEQADLLNGEKPLHLFVAVGRAVMRGQGHICTARSHTMAKRIARALNIHKPTREGV